MFNSSLADQLAKSGVVQQIQQRCRKHGHKSQGAADAQIRAILKAQGNKPDQKDLRGLNSYKCTRVECKVRPWHIGHLPSAKE